MRMVEEYQGGAAVQLAVLKLLVLLVLLDHILHPFIMPMNWIVNSIEKVCAIHVRLFKGQNKQQTTACSYRLLWQ